MRFEPGQIAAIRKLRSKGYTYDEIQSHMGVSIAKSSMWYLCRGIELGEVELARINLLKVRKLRIAQAKAVRRNKELREEMLQRIAKANMQIFKDVSIDTLKVALAMLYLGEGSKWKSFRGLQLGSAEPAILQTYISLLQRCYDIPVTKLRGRIQHRMDQDSTTLEEYWSHILGLPREQFYKSYADKRTAGLPTKRRDYMGVCVIITSGTHIQQELAIIANLLSKYLGH